MTDRLLAAALRLRPLAARPAFCHYPKQRLVNGVNEDGDPYAFRVTDGCRDDCPGCALNRERDAALAEFDAAVEGCRDTAGFKPADR
jgi:hypothetical protein